MTLPKTRKKRSRRIDERGAAPFIYSSVTIVKSALIYAIIILGIAGWWFLAFRTQPPVQTAIPSIVAPSFSQDIPLSPFDRETLKTALGGDFALMGRLMTDWEIDAQLLEQGGLSVKHFPSEKFTRGQFLSRSLEKRTNGLKFLPQSYAAASILLAIAPPDQIVALPKGLRRQTQLFPKSLTDLIPEDVDRFNSERLFLTRPDIAFVSAHYSHPAAIEMLRNQGIAIALLKSLESMRAIQESITLIGQYAQHKSEAELLNLFIDAALMAIDNRKPPLNPETTTLYLTYYTQLTTPSKQTFTYEQLQWLGFEPEQLKESMPLDQEKLFALNPDRLIISTHDPVSLRAKLEGDPAFKGLKAVQSKHLYFLDDIVQQAASQYAVLAYFDIVQALRGNL